MRLYSARAMSSVIGTASIVGAFWTPALALQQPHPTLANGTLAVPMPGTDSVTVVEGPRLHPGDFRRWFTGDLYRDLWTTPIRVPVLNLEKYAGGLKPTKSGGGTQTKTLQFDAADGREFVFRTVDKSQHRESGRRRHSQPWRHGNNERSAVIGGIRRRCRV